MKKKSEWNDLRAHWRKQGKSGCCCSAPDAEASSTDEDDFVNAADLKPHYYFGVTANDLRQADEGPSFDNDITYVSVTTPPPDVVPHNELNVATNAASSQDTVSGATAREASEIWHQDVLNIKNTWG